MLELRDWTDDDLPLLVRTVGDAEMMKHLGGPESVEKIHRRHEILLSVGPSGDGRAYTIRIGPEATVAGSIGFWESEFNGAAVYETGWMVLPEFGNRGIATNAARIVIERARAAGRHRYLHAFPDVANLPSNRVCAKAGFVDLGPCEVEYPLGTMMRANNWRFDLHPERAVSG